MSDTASATMISRCKLCLEDREKRRIEAPGWDIDTEDDYLAVLRHVVDEHPTDPTVEALFDDVEVGIACSACGDPFASAVQVSERGLTIHSYCDDCGGENALRQLIVRPVSPDEVVAEVPKHAE